MTQSEAAEGPSFDLLQEQLIIASRRSRRDVRQLPALVATAARLVWTTNRVHTLGTTMLQLTTAAVSALQVLAAGYVARALIDGGQGVASAELLIALLALAGLTLLGSIAMTAGTQIGRLLGIQVQRRVTDDVLDISTRAELVDYDNPVFHDQLNRVLATMPTQPFLVVTSLASLTGGAAGIAALTVTLLVLSPLLALVVLAVGGPLWFLSRRGGSLEFDFAVSQTTAGRERQYLVDLLTRREFAAETRAYSLASVIRGRFSDLYDTYINQSRTLIRKRYLLMAASGAATALSSTVALLLLYWLVRSGSVDVARAAAGVLAIRLLASRISQAFTGFSSLFQSSLFLADAEAFNRWAVTPAPSAPPLLADVKRGGGRGQRLTGSVELEYVSFTYPNGDSPAVNDLSLTVPAGQIVAIVGENGSGKTTLAKLLAGLYVPDDGHVRWTSADGVEIDRPTAADDIALVLQDFTRYQLSLTDNIALGRATRAPSTASIQEAAVSAGVHGLAEQLPAGYNTRLSRQFAGGRELSLGQWQRIALARAFYRDASFVILDEPAASLDPRAEHQLYESVRSLLAGRTVVLITHRMRSVRGADRIIVMDRGRLVQDGDHETLMSQPGVYADLTALQHQGGIGR